MPPPASGGRAAGEKRRGREGGRRRCGGGRHDPRQRHGERRGVPSLRDGRQGDKGTCRTVSGVGSGPDRRRPGSRRGLHPPRLGGLRGTTGGEGAGGSRWMPLTRAAPFMARHPARRGVGVGKRTVRSPASTGETVIVAQVGEQPAEQVDEDRDAGDRTPGCGESDHGRDSHGDGVPIRPLHHTDPANLPRRPGRAHAPRRPAPLTTTRRRRSSPLRHACRGPGTPRCRSCRRAGGPTRHPGGNARPSDDCS